MSTEITSAGRTEDGGSFYSRMTVPVEINPPSKYRCSKGHEWAATRWEAVACYCLNVPLNGEHVSIPLCPHCIIEFAKDHLGTVEEVK